MTVGEKSKGMDFKQNGFLFVCKDQRDFVGRFDRIPR